MKTIIYLIAIHNTDKYIEESIESITKSFDYAKNIIKNLNTFLIIRDDCSTDSSREKIQNKIQEDNNMFLFKNKQNLGILETRRCLFKDADNLIKEKEILNKEDIYLSFLDSDDLCIETRVYDQLVAFIKDRELKGCGGQPLLFKEEKNIYVPYGILTDYKKNYDDVKVDSLFQSSTISPTMSFRYDWIKKRLDFLEKNKWWANVKIGEDWSAIVDFMEEKDFKYINIDNPVVLYRRHDSAMTNVVIDGLNTDQTKIRKKALSYINLKLTDEEHLLYITISPCRHWGIYNVDYYQKNQKYIYQMSLSLIEKIINANNVYKFYNEKILKKYTDIILYNIKKYENMDLTKVNILLKII